MRSCNGWDVRYTAVTPLVLNSAIFWQAPTPHRSDPDPATHMVTLRIRPLCPYHARNETWWQVPVARDVFYLGM